jgi:hypothetical protein
VRPRAPRMRGRSRREDSRVALATGDGRKPAVGGRPAPAAPHVRSPMCSPGSFDVAGREHIRRCTGSADGSVRRGSRRRLVMLGAAPRTRHCAPRKKSPASACGQDGECADDHSREARLGRGLASALVLAGATGDPHRDRAVHCPARPAHPRSPERPLHRSRHRAGGAAGAQRRLPAPHHGRVAGAPHPGARPHRPGVGGERASSSTVACRTGASSSSPRSASG